MKLPQQITLICQNFNVGCQTNNKIIPLDLSKIDFFFDNYESDGKNISRHFYIYSFYYWNNSITWSKDECILIVKQDFTWRRLHGCGLHSGFKEQIWKLGNS